MVKYESFCNGCRSVGLHCMGSGCDNYYKKPVYYCDVCGRQVDEDCEVDGEHLCDWCYEEKYGEDEDD